MDYHPTELPSLWDMERHLPATSGAREFDAASAQLAAVASKGTSYLSGEREHLESIELLLEKPTQLKREHSSVTVATLPV